MDHDQELELEALKGILNDPSAEPIKLSYGLLKLITYNFSNEIGRGGFGVVYRGDFPNGVVAVKRSNEHNVTDEQFMDEIKCLQSANHKNIVRFVGYCADTQEEVKPLDGKLMMIVERNRLFCFEYVPNGNIRQYLEQEKNHGDDWPTRYKMIRGICQGLEFIHEKQINHLDLKPENIMLDAHMEAKITDFGLSRFLDQGQSRIITQDIFGTLRYIAPEVRDHNQLSFKSDMYSLGIIIIELLTRTSMISLTDWDESLGSLECPRAKMCAEIAQNCVDVERDYRPTIDEVIHRMDELESMMQGFSSLEDFTSSTTLFHNMHQSSSSSRSQSHMHASLDALGYYMMQATAFPGTELLDVYPLELRFLSEPGEECTSCRLTLTNKTDNFVFCIITQTDFKYSLPPMSSSLVTVLAKEGTEIPLHKRKTKKGRKKIPLHSQNGNKGKNITTLGMVGCEILMFTTGSWDKKEHCDYMSKFPVEEDTPSSSEDKLKALQEYLGGELHRAALTTTCVTVERQDPLEVHTVGNEGIYFYVDFMDVHPTEPWVLVTASYRVYIWNWQTNEKLGEYKSPIWLGEEVKDPDERYNGADSVVKFIAQEQWAVIGKRDGSITVHACPTMDQVKEFRAHPDAAVISLAVHPTRPFILTLSDKNSLKIWNWSHDWSCTTTFAAVSSHLWQVKFNPNDVTTFATRGAQGYYQMWRIGRLNPIAITYTGRHKNVSGHHFTYAGHQNLAAIPSRSSIDIWDLWKEKRVHTLHTGEQTSDYQYIHAVCHPTRPILVTLTRYGRIEVWDSVTWRLKKAYEILEEYPIHIAFTGARRLVIGYRKGISMLDIDLE